ncbi:hypothetical protein ITJ43_09080 [Microbacterium sp. VKM Ac-2870]|uniref:hypothetical protein n=1 Tax=Microbacterium sp. VKM Ac-2870 TaxID=2783825 RepID=UPI00188AB473|nr:hypothetical protein [Microbacterium sp. VKM Ac-2870]MBF4562293.1 hypothetical protein [Microbacterium sp. VKM Ac-2870]
MTRHESRAIPEKRPSYEPVTRLLQPLAHDPNMRRPATTVAGAGLVLLSALAGIVSMIDLAAHWQSVAADIVLDVDAVELTSDIVNATLAVVLGVLGIAVVIELICAILLYRGSNAARVVVMMVSVLSISTTFAGWWARDQEITLLTTLPALALNILVLLALSSRSAAAYARRNEKR